MASSPHQGAKTSPPPDRVSAVGRARIALGLTQRELADRTGISLRQIGNLDRGDSVPRRATALVLALALDCRPSELRAGGE